MHLPLLMYFLLPILCCSKVRRATKETSGSRETSSLTSTAAWLSPWGQNRSAGPQSAQYRGPANRQHHPTSDPLSCRPPGLEKSLQGKPTFSAFTRSSCSPHTKNTISCEASSITSNSQQTLCCSSFGQRCEEIPRKWENTGDPACWPRDTGGAYRLASTIWSPSVGYSYHFWGGDHEPSRFATSTFLLPRPEWPKTSEQWMPRDRDLSRDTTSLSVPPRCLSTCPSHEAKTLPKTSHFSTPPTETSSSL